MLACPHGSSSKHNMQLKAHDRYGALRAVPRTLNVPVASLAAPDNLPGTSRVACFSSFTGLAGIHAKPPKGCSAGRAMCSGSADSRQPGQLQLEKEIPAKRFFPVTIFFTPIKIGLLGRRLSSCVAGERTCMETRRRQQGTALCATAVA